jgi:hypothetical protein
MWEPEPLTTLRASKACRGENFTFTFYLIKDSVSIKISITSEVFIKQDACRPVRIKTKTAKHEIK